MKFAIVLITLLTHVLAQDEFLTKDSPTIEDPSVIEEPSIIETRAKPIKVNSVDGLLDFGYVVKIDGGSAEDFDKALASKELEIDFYESSVIDPNTKLIDLYSRDSSGGGRRLGTCSELTGSGVANDVVLTLNISSFGFNFHVDITCGEDCCARAFECTHTSCKLTCQGGQFIRIRTFSPFISCCMNGRETVFFGSNPTGPCSDQFLCGA